MAMSIAEKLLIDNAQQKKEGKIQPDNWIWTRYDAASLTEMFYDEWSDNDIKKEIMRQLEGDKFIRDDNGCYVDYDEYMLDNDIDESEDSEDWEYIEEEILTAEDVAEALMENGYEFEWVNGGQ